MKTYRHCEVHGYSQMHVSTPYGLKCVRCIQSRRKAHAQKQERRAYEKSNR